MQKYMTTAFLFSPGEHRDIQLLAEGEGGVGGNTLFKTQSQLLEPSTCSTLAPDGARLNEN